MPPRIRSRRNSSASVQTVKPYGSRRTSSSSEATIKPSDSYDTDFLLIGELDLAGAQFESYLQNKRSLNDAGPPSDDDILADIISHSNVSSAAKNFSNHRRQIEVFLESGYGDMPVDVLEDHGTLAEVLNGYVEDYNDAIDRLYKEGAGKDFPLPKDIAYIDFATFGYAVNVAQHVKEANAHVEAELPWRESLQPGLEKEIEEFIAKYWPLTAAFALSNSKINVLKGRRWIYPEDHEKFRDFYKRRITSMRDRLHREEAEWFASYTAKLAKFKALVDGHGMDAVSMATRHEE